MTFITSKKILVYQKLHLITSRCAITALNWSNSRRIAGMSSCTSAVPSFFCKPFLNFPQLLGLGTSMQKVFISPSHNVPSNSKSHSTGLLQHCKCFIAYPSHFFNSISHNLYPNRQYQQVLLRFLSPIIYILNNR